MKLSLPLKLGIGVVLLFAAVIAICLPWTPIKIRHYMAKLKSDDTKERVDGVTGLLASGTRGRKALAENYNGSEADIVFLAKHWGKTNSSVSGDEFERHPIHIAAKQGYIASIRLYILNGADVNVKDRRGWTPLHWASFCNKKDVVSFLIDKGANVNAKRDTGWTALHYAALRGHKEIVEILLFEGADVNVVNSFDLTPLDNAYIHKRRKIADLLRSRGAKTGEELKNESSVKSQGSSIKEEEKK
ncbi:MAG: ankyrin repeat domain-containing protein [Planctomycetota bacterium]|nr:MAG: ankyrin repeat domain-containing protein [Planctomycetota bacterium]